MNKEKRTLLAVGAHPDDIDFMASGTVAKFVEEEWQAYYVICTDGSRGSADPKSTHAKMAEIRRREQLAAGKILGLTDIFFLDHTDTQLQADQLLKEQIVRLIRQVRPEIVITIDPTFLYSLDTNPVTGTNFINHTDHRAAGQATIDAVFPMARDRLTFPEHEKEGLAPHKVRELWLVNQEKKHYLVNVTKQFPKKLKAIAAHESQYDDFPAIEKRMTHRALEYAKEEDFQFGESFVRLIMP